MNRIAALFAALRHGASLADPAGWKQRQNLMNALVGVLGAIALFLPMEISDADVAAIAGGIAAVVGLLNAYLTTATTDKLGLPARRDTDDENRERGPYPGP